MVSGKNYHEQIIEAAFEIARTEGIESITVRKIAEKNVQFCKES